MSEQSKLGDLTKLMLFFGRVPETHIETLQSYPYIYFNGLHEAKLDYSIETTDKIKPTIFSYDLLLSPEALNTNNHMELRYKALESSVRLLFWKEVKLQVKINGQEVYKSE